MAQDADLWASTPGARVSLADLPDTVERELRIIKSEAIRALRHPLEMGFVHARVEGWLDTSQQFEDSEDWVWSERIGGPDLIALEGWQHVNWNEGTLAGHPISVRWDHVVRELATLAARVQRDSNKATGSAKRAAGGATPRHDWEAFWIEVALYAAKNDLNPEHRLELQRHMVDWTAHMWPEPPDPATIRARLKKLYDAQRAARN